MMPKPEIITSTANPKVKHLRALQEKNRLRRDEKLIIVEGKKEIDRAFSAGFTLQELFACPELASETPESVTLVSRDIFAKIAYRENRDGLLALFHEPAPSLKDISLSQKPFVMIVEGIEKPGNLGAIIRSGDGAGIDAIIVTDQRCDIWNPNTIRASVGTIFTTPVISCSNEEAAHYLADHHIQAYAAELLPEAQLYTTPDLRQPTALIVGTEAQAVSEFWLQRATGIYLPMHGQNSSLNVSNAAAILMYEVVRQRSQA